MFPDSTSEENEEEEEEWQGKNGKKAGERGRSVLYLLRIPTGNPHRTRGIAFFAPG